MGKQIVDAIKARGKKFVPIADADVGGFVDPAPRPDRLPGPQGRGRDQHRRRRRRRVTLALKLLNGETVTDRPAARQPNTVLLDPVLVDNTTDAGKADAEGLAVRAGHGSALAAQPRDRGLDDLRPEHRPARPARARSTRPVHPAGDAGSAGALRSAIRTGPMTLTATDLLLEATGVSKTYGAVVALQVRVAGRPARARSTR